MRTRSVAIIALVPGALAVAPALAAAPTSYILPGPRVFPEGVATAPGRADFFVTSTSDGTVFRGALGRRALRPFLPAGRDGRTTAVGVKRSRDRLVVAGGATGQAWVYALPSGRLLRRLRAPGGFVNDVAITPGGDAYLTDSSRGLLYRIPAAGTRRGARGVRRLGVAVRLSRAIAPAGSLSANGIAPTPDGRAVLFVTTSGGRLYRFDPLSRAVSEVPVAGAPAGAAPLTAGDGMIGRGRTLYVVSVVGIAKLALSADGRRARLVRRAPVTGLRFPTTAAIAGSRLLVVNSQFDRRSAGTPDLPFTVASRPLP